MLQTKTTTFSPTAAVPGDGSDNGDAASVVWLPFPPRSQDLSMNNV
jgi:hypothetical protein